MEMSSPSKELTGFQRFLQVFVANWRKLAITMLSLGATPPLLDLAFNIGPPWPHRKAVAFFTTVVLWLVLLWTYTNWKGASRRTVRLAVNVFGFGLVLTMPFYIWTTAYFTRATSSSTDREVIGITLTKPAQGMVDRGMPIDRIFASAEWEPTVVWEPGGVAFARLLVLGSWLMLFGLLATVSACFLLQFEEDS